MENLLKHQVVDRFNEIYSRTWTEEQLEQLEDLAKVARGFNDQKKRMEFINLFLFLEREDDLRKFISELKEIKESLKICT